MQGRSIAMATLPLDAQDLVRAGGGEPWRGAPKGTRIGHVHLHVSDLDKAASFYHAGLGFDRVVLDFPGALFLSAGGYHHHLGTNTWAVGAPSATDGDARLLEWTVQVPFEKDVDEAARSLAAGGHEIAQEGRDAVGEDPWGTKVRITTG
jgi:catechol 2,3-dioxygenase